MTSSFAVGICYKHRKSQLVHDLVLCVNTIGPLYHTYPELSVARATLVLLVSGLLIECHIGCAYWSPWKRIQTTELNVFPLLSEIRSPDRPSDPLLLLP